MDVGRMLLNDMMLLELSGSCGGRGGDHLKLLVIPPETREIVASKSGTPSSDAR